MPPLPSKSGSFGLNPLGANPAHHSSAELTAANSGLKIHKNPGEFTPPQQEDPAFSIGRNLRGTLPVKIVKAAIDAFSNEKPVAVSKRTSNQKKVTDQEGRRGIEKEDSTTPTPTSEAAPTNGTISTAASSADPTSSMVQSPPPNNSSSTEPATPNNSSSTAPTPPGDNDNAGVGGGSNFARNVAVGITIPLTAMASIALYIRQRLFRNNAVAPAPNVVMAVEEEEEVEVEVEGEGEEVKAEAEVGVKATEDLGYKAVSEEILKNLDLSSLERSGTTASPKSATSPRGLSPLQLNDSRSITLQ